MRFFILKQITIISFLSLAFISNAQQDPLYSQYMFNPMVLNPAYAGIYEMGMATTTGRQQWTGIDGSPTTLAANFHTALPIPKMGAGITVARESYGITTNTEIQAAFAYHLRLKEDKLNFGVLGSFNRYNIDYSSDKLNTNPEFASDPNIDQTSSIIESSPNFGFGAMYTAKRYFVGVSVPKIVSVNIEDENTSSSLNFLRHYYLTGGYIIKLSSGAIIKPSALVRIPSGAANTPTNIDLNGSVLLKEKLWLGTSFRTSTKGQILSSVVLMAQIQLNDFIKFGYSMDTYTGGELLRASKFATHEVMLNINFPVFGSQAVQEILY